MKTGILFLMSCCTLSLTAQTDLPQIESRFSNWRENLNFSTQHPELENVPVLLSNILSDEVNSDTSDHFQPTVLAFQKQFTQHNNSQRFQNRADYPSIASFDYGGSIAPIVSANILGVGLVGGDSIHVNSIEVGVALVHGNMEDVASWGMLPLLTTWQYASTPFVSMEYRWYQPYEKDSISAGEVRALPNVMLNVGINGGCGALLLILPLGINGSAALSTDFRDLYFRWKVSWDAAIVSVGMGQYVNMTRKATLAYDMNSPFLSISYHPWEE